LPLSTLLRHPTVEALAARLDADGAAAEAPAPLLVPLRAAGERAPLFVLPGGGGNALYLHHLARRLGAGRPVWGLQPPGLDGAEAPLRRIPDLAARYLPLLRGVAPAGPYLLAGHSFGARVALELALGLRAAGERVGLLAVLDNTPSWAGGEEPEEAEEPVWLAAIARAAAGVTGHPAPLGEPELRTLPEAARLPRLRSHLEETGFLPPGAPLDQVKGFLDVFRANAEAARRYRPRAAPLGAPILLLCPEEDPPEEAERKRRAWAAFGEVALRTVPGGHVGMLTEPHVGAVARLLAEAMEAAAA
jgi:thioesterase domain-containing protein